MFASPTFTGTVSGITATMVGLSNVTNESKTTMFASPTFTGTVSGITATMVGLSNVTNESKSQMFSSPTFTGTVSGITATMVGLSNVTNESKSQMFSSPTFTGTVSGITKSMVGLGNVDNTADTSKSVLYATTAGGAPATDVYTWAKAATKPAYTAAEIGLGNVANESKASLFTSPAFTEIPTAPTATAGTNTTQIATTAFVSTAVSNLVDTAPAALNTLNELATALGNDANFATTISTAIGLKAPSTGATLSGATISNAIGMSFASGVAVDQFSSDGFFTDNASNIVPVQRAVKTYVDTGLGLKANLTSPAFTTSIDGSATFGAFASSSTLTIGFTGTSTTNITNIATAMTGVGYSKTVNIGTGASGGTTTINIGNVSNSTTFINGHVVLETVTSTGATGSGKIVFDSSPTFTGTVSGITATMVGLGNVTNESKATMFTSPTFTGTVSGITATMVGLGNVTNESKATMFTSPTFTGTPTGITATHVGLGNVTNESKATMFTSSVFTGVVTLPGVTEAVTTLAGISSVVSFDINATSVFYITPSASFTPNFVNMPTMANKMLTVTLVISQGGTAYMPSAYQLGGSTLSPSVSWVGGSQPAGSSNKTDVINLSFYYNASNALTKVLGSVATYG
jgi:hypothetical protein